MPAALALWDAQPRLTVLRCVPVQQQRAPRHGARPACAQRWRVPSLHQACGARPAFESQRRPVWAIRDAHARRVSPPTGSPAAAAARPPVWARRAAPASFAPATAAPRPLQRGLAPVAPAAQQPFAAAQNNVAETLPAGAQQRLVEPVSRVRVRRCAAAAVTLCAAVLPAAGAPCARRCSTALGVEGAAHEPAVERGVAAAVSR